MSTRILVALCIAITADVAAAEPAASADVASAAGTLSPHLSGLAAPLPGGPILAGVEGAGGSGMSGILSGALYGGLVGAAIGAAVGLIEGGNYGRDIGIGAGVGVLAGAALGAANVFGDARPLPAQDGLGSTDRDPVLNGPSYVRLAARF